MKIYYLHNGQEQEGPFTLEDLKIKNITADTPVWYEGLTEWTVAERVYELKELFPLSVAVPPGVAQVIPPAYETEPKKKRSMGKIIVYAIIILIVIIVGFIAMDLMDSI